MKIYNVRADAKGFTRLVFRSQEDFQTANAILSTGKPLSVEDRLKIPMVYMSKSGYNNSYFNPTIGDCINLSNRCLVLSEKAFNTLGKYIRGYTDSVKLRCYNYIQPLYLINVWNLDYTQNLPELPVSSYTTPTQNDFTSGSGFIPKLGSKIPYVFKLQNFSISNICCTKDFQNVVRVAGLTGFWFNTVDDRVFQTDQSVDQ